MPKGFNYRWTVSAGNRVHQSGLYGDTCRDSAVVSLTNQIAALAQECITEEGKAYLRRMMNSDYRRFFAVQCHDLLKIEGMVAHNSDTPNEVVDKVIEILQPMFPSMTFERNNIDDPVTGHVWPGVIVKGGSDVVEAWYWAGLLLRVATVFNYQNAESFEKGFLGDMGNAVLGMYYKSEDADWHYHQWKLMPDAVVKPGWRLLMYGSGSGPRVAQSYSGEIDAWVSMYKGEAGKTYFNV